MKKLMIAAAIVCAAVVSQAGTFVWGFTSDEIVGPTADYNDGEGYINFGTATAYLYVLGSDGETWNPADTATQNPSTYKWGYFDKANPRSSDFVNTMTGLDDTAQTFKMLLVTDDEKYQIEVVGTADIVEYVDGGTGTTYYRQQFLSGKGTSAGDWTAVPEPTSGLLLLLGVAGLALKRKRA